MTVSGNQMCKMPSSTKFPCCLQISLMPGFERCERQSSNTNARVMAPVLSHALDPTFGIHSHRTLDIAQLNPVIFSRQTENLPLLTVFPPQLISIPSFCYSHCVHVCVCVCAQCECFHIIPYVNYSGRCSQIHVYRILYLG